MLLQLQQDFRSIQSQVDTLNLRLSALESSVQSHFDLVRSHPACIVAESYDDPSRYRQFNRRDLTGHVFHSPEMRAAGFVNLAGNFSIARQFHIPIPRFERERISVQWEAWYDPRWQQGVKAFQLDCGTQSLGIEVNCFRKRIDFALPTELGNYELLTSVRFYGGGPGSQIGGAGTIQPLSVIEPGDDDPKKNWNPPLWTRGREVMAGRDRPGHVGEGGRSYFIRAGQWVRYTLSWSLEESPARFWLWVADERTDPTLVIGNKDGSGFILEPRPDKRWVRLIRMPEFNSSEGNGASPIDVTTYVRNVVVYRGADVPLGGRP